MKKALLAAVVMLPLITPVRADIVVSNPPLVDLGGTGFGVAPRLLTLQNNGNEAGGTFALPGGVTGFTDPTGATCTAMGATSCPNHQPDTGANESKVYSLQALGWLTGANVGIGLDTNERGNSTGLTLATLSLQLYNNLGQKVGTPFSLASKLDITADQLAFQQGNGNSVFNFGLSALEQLTFTALVNANGGPTALFEGLTSSLGCFSGTPGTPGCLVSSDGADSFLAFNQVGAVGVPAPIAGAGIPGLFAGALLLLARRRRRQLTA